MRWRKHPSPNVDEENPYWMSFSDIMAGLLVIFILASVILIVQLLESDIALQLSQEQFEDQSAQLEQRVAILERAEQVRRTILEEVAKELQKRGIKVEISQNDAAIRIPNELLGFETAEHVIRSRYQRTAMEIGLVLSEVIARDDRIDYLDTIFVEGHTDSRPFHGFLGMGNWGLSTFRAISLWQFWTDQLPDDSQLANLTNREGDPLFSVSGYGETRPVIEEQVTEDDFRVNRRIDVRFTIRRPTIEEYEAVRDSVVGATP